MGVCLGFSLPSAPPPAMARARTLSLTINKIHFFKKNIPTNSLMLLPVKTCSLTHTHLECGLDGQREQDQRERDLQDCPVQARRLLCALSPHKPCHEDTSSPQESAGGGKLIAPHAPALTSRYVDKGARCESRSFRLLSLCEILSCQHRPGCSQTPAPQS